MDVYDAGVYAYRYEADAPRGLKVVLWGPLQAKELGFDGWNYQDGGETGFVYHSDVRAVKLGRATATLTFVRRLGRAFLTLYLAGYPSDAPGSQRRLDVQSIVTEAELFLTRLAKQPVRFHQTGAHALVDRHDAPATAVPPTPPSGAVFEV
jgi:hypothetical protein